MRRSKPALLDRVFLVWLAFAALLPAILFTVALLLD